MSEILLLSGGIDSIALAAWKKPTLCLTVDYGQRAAKAEIRASGRVCQELGLRHEVISAPISSLGAGDMSNFPGSQHSKHSEFWPFRNQYLITLGAMYALNHGYSELMIGSVATDHHVDGSCQFIETASQLLGMQEGQIRLSAPAINLTSPELVSVAQVPVEALGWAHSCHMGELACGQCGGCRKHSEVMAEIGWNR